MSRPWAVWALGDPGPLPFLGHFRATGTGPGSWLAAAGRTAATADAEAASHAAGVIENTVRHVGSTIDLPSDRHALLAGLWTRLAELPPDALGPDHGAHLSLLVVAADTRGVSVTGVGLAHVWYRRGRTGLRPLVPPGHPLLSPLGRPEQPPGVMTLSAQLDVVVAELRHPSAPPRGKPTHDLARACGVHR